MQEKYSKLLFRYRKSLYILAALAVITIITINIFNPPTTAAGNAPQEMLLTAVDKAKAAEGFAFTSQSTLQVNDKKLEYGQIEGQFWQGDCHVWGKILDGEINFFQIDNISYRQDEITGQWIVEKNNSLQENAILLNELDPLSNLNFTNVGPVSYLGKEKIGDEKTTVLSFSPTLANEWINENFYNIGYTLYISNKTGYPLRLLITAQTSSGDVTGTLNTEINFYDWNKNIPITPPVTTTTQ